MSRKQDLSVVLVLVVAACSETRSLDREATSLSPSEDMRQIVGAVLEREASLPRERPPVCVRRRTEGLAFDQIRDHFRMLRQQRPRNPQDAEFIRQSLAGSQTLIQEWRRPVSLQNGVVATAPRIEGPEAERLDVAAREIINGAPRGTEAMEIDPEVIPQSLRRRFALSCSTLTLTAPAISNSIAFVESSYVCGGLCGNGWLYALERKQGRWQLVAVAFTWVS